MVGGLILSGLVAPRPALAAPRAAPASATIVLNEFVASNQTGLRDEDGDTSDWIELYNASASPIDLTGWAVSDNPDNPAKWILPARTLASHAFLLVFASGKDRTPASGELHTNFNLDASGEFLALFDNASPRQVVDQFTPAFPRQYPDISYGRFDSAGALRFFAHPTPAAPNDTASAYLGVVSDVTFSHSRGYYPEATFTVDLQTATPGASIRYSRTGYAPSTSTGTLYSGPVSIYDSMPLRAIAYRSQYIPSRVETHTYLMPTRIMRQPTEPSGFPLTWGTFNGLPVPADYEMDPTVVDDPRYHDTFVDDLRSLPALILSASRTDLFDPYTGIYSNPMQSGMDWERPVSVELINPDGSTAFQIDAGLRIHGNSTRQPDVTPKHSFRLHFRSDYGASALHYPLFPGSPVDTFQDIVLYAMFDDSWLYRQRASYVRDPWTGGTEIAMGRLGVHSKFVHLTIDGLYWGLYDMTEHIEGQFAASYLGGSENDYDVISDGGVDNVIVVNGDLQAWNAMIDIAEAGLADPANYQAIQQYLDLEDLIDFMLMHIYGGNAIAWTNTDWRAIRRREPGGRFDFLCWDNGSFLESAYLNSVDVGSDAPNTPAYLYWRLRDNPEFRLLFADRVQQHFFNGGVFYVDPANPAWDPLHPERNQPASRFYQLAQSIDRAVVPESARWGDVAQPGTVFNRNDHWLPERNRLLNSLFPQRSQIVLQQLRDANLYPLLDAPTFNQHGGSVPAGFQLAIAAPAGAIFFTTDGSDPRLAGSGAVSPSAIAYSAPFTLPGGTTTVNTRSRSGATWSALTQATFEAPLDLSTLKVTEIMYNPLGDANYEFLELKNTGPLPLNLAGVRLASAISFAFPTGATLPPGQLAVLVNDAAAFASRYPTVPIAGQFARDLANGGDTIELVDPSDATFLTLTYDDDPPWPAPPDGSGYSLVLVDPNADPNLPANWRSSTFPHGSPGADDPAPLAGSILINEVLANSSLPFEDAIELFNPSPSPVAIGGWFLSDDPATLAKFRIPDATTIAPFGYKVFYEYQFNPAPGTPPSFALSSLGENLFLASANPSGAFTGYTTSFTFEASAANTSLGRHPTSYSVETPQLSRPTFGVETPISVQHFRSGTGAPNAYPLVGPLAINEINYNPGPTGHEFLELANITDAALPLYDLANPAATWRLTNGISFTFPANTTLPPRSLALVVPIDPATFSALYNVPPDVPLFGPYTGQLDDAGERITLARPDTPVAGSIPWIPVDSIAYDDTPPWPTSPDGAGPSLERLSGPTFANDPALWAPSTATGSPGRTNAACFFADVHPNPSHASPSLCDGDVDIADIQSVAACWNRPLAAPGCPPTLNVDGQDPYFSTLDIVATANHWQWHR